MSHAHKTAPTSFLTNQGVILFTDWFRESVLPVNHGCLRRLSLCSTLRTLPPAGSSFCTYNLFVFPQYTCHMLTVYHRKIKKKTNM